MRKTVLCLLLPFFALAVAAEEGGEPPAGIESTPSVFLQLTTEPGAKLGFNWRFDFPLMRGEGPLTQGNGVILTPGIEVTPVSLNLTLNAIWTPIAFVEVVAGGRIGSGWNAVLFGDDSIGIGLNTVGDNGAAVVDGSAFDGALWEARTGVAVQGDLSAVFPGEWNQVIARSFHGIRHAGYSRAGSGDFWFFENDEGENRNGLSYRGNLLLGYRMPLPLNMVALLAETDVFLHPSPRPQHANWTFTAITAVGITERLGANLLAQFRIRDNYVGEGWRNQHFTVRDVSESNPRRLEFFRVVAAFSYRL